MSATKEKTTLHQNGNHRGHGQQHHGESHQLQRLALMCPVSLFIFATAPRILSTKDGSVIFQRRRGEPKPSFLATTKESKSKEDVTTKTAAGPAASKKKTPPKAGRVRLVLRDVCSKHQLPTANRTKHDLIQQLVTFYSTGSTDSAARRELAHHHDAFLEDLAGKYDVTAMEAALHMAKAEAKEAQKLKDDYEAAAATAISNTNKEVVPSSILFDKDETPFRTPFLALYNEAHKFGVAPASTLKSFTFHGIRYNMEDIQNELTGRLKSIGGNGDGDTETLQQQQLKLPFLPPLSDFHLQNNTQSATATTSSSIIRRGKRRRSPTKNNNNFGGGLSDIYNELGVSDDDVDNTDSDDDDNDKIQGMETKKRPSPSATPTTSRRSSTSSSKQKKPSKRRPTRSSAISASKSPSSLLALDQQQQLLVEATAFSTNLLLGAKEMERLGIVDANNMIQVMRLKAQQTMKEALGL
jgi:hypothetical protein